MTGRETNSGRVFREIRKREKLARRYREKQWSDRMKDEKKSSTKVFVSSNIRRAGRVAKRLRQKVLSPKTAHGAGDLGLDRQKAAERKKLYIRKERIAVYTALFGTYDAVREPLWHPENIDYFILTDQAFPADSLWKECGRSHILPQEILGNPILCNRWCKMHPHLLFPEYDYSIYVDANIWIFSDLTPVTAWLDRYPTAMFRHKKRDCVYDEVQACIDLKKANEKDLRQHGELLRAHGIPLHWGLLEASVIARKHGDPRCVSLMSSWWESFRSNSKRDQISLIDVLWQAGISPQQIGTLGRNLQRCDLFIQMQHETPGGPAQPETLEELKAVLMHTGKTRYPKDRK